MAKLKTLYSVISNTNNLKTICLINLISQKFDNFLWKDDGCNNEVDYLSQFSWILFLKYLEDFEDDSKTRAALDGKKYTPILDDKYKWSSWGKNEGKKFSH